MMMSNSNIKFDTVVVDADVMVYTTAFSAERRVYTADHMGQRITRFGENGRKELEGLVDGVVEGSDHTADLASCFKSLDEQLDTLRELFSPTSMKLFLSGSDNYREGVAEAAPYKGTRSPEKPERYQAIRDYLIEERGARVVSGAEADDEVSMAMYLGGEDVVAVTVDKDAKNTPGYIYNPRTEELVYVDKKEAMHHFCTQMLTGDSSDNIKGVVGIGPKKAEKLLYGCSNTEDYYAVISEAYGDKDLFLENARLLHMSRVNYDDYLTEGYMAKGFQNGD
jgi:hypothetical protein